MARKKANIHYIYKTICNVTGKWYIGMHSTINLEDGYMGSGKILRHSIRKYGKENHIKEILEYLSTREALVLREIDIVTKELISDGFCMNLKEGGSGGFINLEICSSGGKIGGEIHRERLKNEVEHNIKNKIIAIENLRKAHEEGKISYGNFKDKTHTKYSKEKISRSMKNKGIGETNSQYGTCWITKDGVSKKVRKEDLDAHIIDSWVKGRK